MKSAAFKLDDVKPYGNVKIYTIETDSQHQHNHHHGSEEEAASTRTAKTGCKKNFDPNDMILDNNIVMGGEDRENEKMAKEEQEILDNHKHTIPQGNPHSLFEFRSVKFQTFVEP